MPPTHLTACPACARHARASELTCPFCGADVGETMRASSPRVPPAGRLSRAALVAFGVGSVAVVAACGDVASGGATGEDSGRHDAVGAPDAPRDVARTLPDARGDAPGDARRDTSNVVVPYGLPPPFDAGHPTDAGHAADARERVDVGFAPPYGLPGH